MPPILPSFLVDTFVQLSASTWQGVPGVHVVDGGRPGPTLGITICTHGNEPSGLAAYHHLLHVARVADALLCGRIIFVLNNIEAARKFITATDDETVRTSRYVDVNMNRLPDDLATRTADNRYEIQRAQQLLPVWQQFTIGFDIHSTVQHSAPMIIAGREFLPQLARGFPMRKVLSNIHVVQIGNPAFAFYGMPGADIPTIEIESGQHTDPASYERAIACSQALLRNLGMLAGETAPAVDAYEHYRIAGSIVLPGGGWQLARPFVDFAPVHAGEPAAIRGGEAVNIPFDGHSIFAPVGTDIGYSAEEVMFLSDPVRTLSAV